MKNFTCLLLGRKEIIVDDVRDKIEAKDIMLLSGTGLQHVKDAFAQNNVDHVIMGAGISLDDRLEIIRYIFEVSNSTTVHMKDRDSGPPGMIPFVNGVLKGLIT